MARKIQIMYIEIQTLSKTISGQQFLLIEAEQPWWSLSSSRLIVAIKHVTNYPQEHTYKGKESKTLVIFAHFWIERPTYLFLCELYRAWEGKWAGGNPLLSVHRNA